ncbi:MAG: site-specific DNA-methyltransferase [Muribaculaceae bacterium]|nr:site-specific DNA-methyltransferase [Muribaculaceae bacterium]
MAQNKINKLELTWIGKEEEPAALEPRLLIDTPEYSFGEVETGTLPNGKQWPGNMLIHGDNLLALRALEENFTGSVKCIYIDPPFNTGSRIDADGKEIGYDDGIEHSTWLNMMYSRFQILHRLLREDGALFVHLDDNESDYCKVILDEIFGRNNFMNRVTIDARSPSAFSTVNPGMFVASEHILFYAKNRSKLVENRVRTVRNPDYAYNKFILNYEKGYENWEFIPLLEAFSKFGKVRSDNPEAILKSYNKFIIENADRICRYTAISDSGAGQQVIELKKLSLINQDKIFKLERSEYDDIFIINGQQIAFYSKNIHIIDGTPQATKLLTDIWTDIAWEGIAKEGDVTFKKGKKPEKLLKRCIELATSSSEDIVLDSFLGSGTTAAVAHKMGRRWIGIELGNHAYSHCVHRLSKVVAGNDQSGISKSQNWKGGGGFKFYELAPSLLNHDKYGNLIINKEYNADMLAAAMAKHQGFTYSPDKDIYWEQGHSSEHDYIFTTTQLVTAEMLGTIHEQMDEDDSLLICCSKFQPECRNKYPNITIKKIPKVLLDTCEFDRDDYSLNIVSVPDIEDEEREDFDPDGEFTEENNPTLFDE